MTAAKPVQLDRIPVLDYRKQPGASNLVLPQAAMVSNLDRSNQWHFEVQQQPAHDTGAHLHQMHIVTMVTSGTSINQSIEGKFQQNLAGSNNIFMLPAGALHRCEWQQEIEFMFVGIDPQSLVKIAEESIDRDRIELIPHFATISDPLLQGILFALKQESIATMPSSHLFIEQLQVTLAMHLLRSYSVRQVPIMTYSDGLSHHKLVRVTEYIAAHLDRDLGLSELARQAEMSQFYFSRLFKRSLGVTPHQYVIQQRVERAKRLIGQCQLSFAEIALECGFANQGHLNWHFKRLTGVTPKEIARTCKNSTNL
ncbi:helix-turn-helix domain-containing protein [Chamaesiphon minutus]|uniref:Transcriptional regulator containing an amidase domain and an AraC-type DNA-binding HTH domain n=1 Tax=Chamaesiphon minutus (strain ATCC 27169 / PCC 6605) TaxID=1173020 RepID=K9UNT2_CHAP6|nr:AraC family transcriptional regulator [Chamaesiphon minutus]AFY96485.1 transcriptional regulator containing an amidase domain and an AraC-type DNA-binding HTH domain [Chamaesiphon minutus PCC 6605]